MEAHSVLGSTGARPTDGKYLEYPPPGREGLIGRNGFGVVVKGESMAGRDIHDGDLVWVNPDAPWRWGSVVLALATSDAGARGMVIKTFEDECLVSDTTTGRRQLVCCAFKVIGPVVGITSWRLPPPRSRSYGVATPFAADRHVEPEPLARP